MYAGGLISYSKERRFSIFQTLPDFLKQKAVTSFDVIFINKCTVEIIWAKYEETITNQALVS